jgi:hypothetical protein
LRAAPDVYVGIGLGGHRMAGHEQKKETPEAELDRKLDRALEGTFPASDPVSIGDATSAKPDRPAGRKPASIDKRQVDRLAREVGKKKSGHA